MRKEQPEHERNGRGEQQAELPGFEADPGKTDEAKEAHEENRNNQENKEAMEWWQIIYRKLFVGKSAAWTAIFTCVLCIFSYLLWQVSDAANRLAIATQAASISSVGPVIIKQANPDGKTLKGWNIVFGWINSGNTPTKTAELQSNVYVGTASPSKGLDFSQLPQDRIVTAVVAPHQAMQLTPGFVTLQDADDVTAGKKHMFFWGWAVYHDGIDPRARLAEYCFNVEAVTFPKTDHADFTQDASFISNPCGVHFCFDEDCEDYKDRTK
jgi:hypothetical protein